MIKFTSEELVTELMWRVEATALLGKCHGNYNTFKTAHDDLQQFLGNNALALLNVIPEDMGYSSADKFNEICTAVDDIEYETAMELITAYVRY